MLPEGSRATRLPPKRYRCKQYDLQYDFLGGRDETRTELKQLSGEVARKTKEGSLTFVRDDGQGMMALALRVSGRLFWS